MKTAVRPFLFLLTVMTIVSLACGFPGANATQAPTQSDQPVQQATPEPTKPSSNAVSSLDAVKSATVQIEAQGTFVDPAEGLLVNVAGRGTGFIIDPSGIAVTNNHVVAGAALLKVWVGGESTPRNARVLGLSECSDLAVIDIDGDGFPYMEWYTGPVTAGLEVYSAGFPLGEPEFNLTKGIISKENANGDTSWASVERVYGHDATINPGNSGGPLVNANGQVVGVNFSFRSAANQYFAIGREVAQSVIAQLREGKDVNSIGVNGVAVATEDGSLSGIWVSSVKSGSPADKAGIKPGDIIYQLEGLVLATDGTMKDYCDVLRSHSPTDTLSMSVIRYGTGEYLEGQLNGRELSVTGNFNTGGSSGGSASGGGEAQAFFTEYFDGDLSNWSYYVNYGNENAVTLSATSGGLNVLINATDTSVYVYYQPYIYTDVILEIQAENLGRNNNNVSLICRYDDARQTWYEFSIANNGLYWIYAYDGNYNVIANGGSNNIRQGKDKNIYTVGCIGDTLSLFINGKEVKTVRDTQYRFKEGQVALNLTSFNVTPIEVDFNYFSIIQP
ncbi:MAG: trypsin-like peptidase domain-containing protein [Anaerolineales bacterium]